MTDAFVLDAWALLAFLQGEEPAASRVKSLLQEARNEKVIVYSYADAFAASTSLQHGAILLTGDPELLELAGKFPLEKLQ